MSEAVKCPIFIHNGVQYQILENFISEAVKCPIFIHIGVQYQIFDFGSGIHGKTKNVNVTHVPPIKLRGSIFKCAVFNYYSVVSLHENQGFWIASCTCFKASRKKIQNAIFEETTIKFHF